MPRSLLALVATALLVASCADPTGESSERRSPPDATTPANNIEPRCLPGCIEPDPDPSHPGIFLSSAVTDVTCFSGMGTDADQDLMADRCERDLAQAFAPQLFYDRDDDVRREPYWVAGRPTGAIPTAGGPHARIVYLLSYYEDLGGQTFSCRVPGAHFFCLPHHGDSEWIALDVRYNRATQHWLLTGAVLSQHTSYAAYGTPTNKSYTPYLTYPNAPGGFPRVWVAYGKHANYRSQSACNEGGTFGTDTCEFNDTPIRVEYSGAYNVGSRGTRLKDCVASRNPAWQFYGTESRECYWSSSDPSFRGWYLDNIGGGSAKRYGSILSNLGF